MSSLQTLPIELQFRIAFMLPPSQVTYMATLSRRFRTTWRFFTAFPSAVDYMKNHLLVLEHQEAERRSRLSDFELKVEMNEASLRKLKDAEEDGFIPRFIHVKNESLPQLGGSHPIFLAALIKLKGWGSVPDLEIKCDGKFTRINKHIYVMHGNCRQHDGWLKAATRLVLENNGSDVKKDAPDVEFMAHVNAFHLVRNAVKDLGDLWDMHVLWSDYPFQKVKKGLAAAVVLEHLEFIQAIHRKTKMLKPRNDRHHEKTLLDTIFCMALQHNKLNVLECILKLEGGRRAPVRCLPLLMAHKEMLDFVLGHSKLDIDREVFIRDAVAKSVDVTTLMALVEKIRAKPADVARALKPESYYNTPLPGEYVLMDPLIPGEWRKAFFDLMVEFFVLKEEHFYSPQRQCALIAAKMVNSQLFDPTLIPTQVMDVLAGERFKFPILEMLDHPKILSTGHAEKLFINSFISGLYKVTTRLLDHPLSLAHLAVRLVLFIAVKKSLLCVLQVFQHPNLQHPAMFNFILNAVEKQRESAHTSTSVRPEAGDVAGLIFWFRDELFTHPLTPQDLYPFHKFLFLDWENEKAGEIWRLDIDRLRHEFTDSYSNDELEIVLRLIDGSVDAQRAQFSQFIRFVHDQKRLDLVSRLFQTDQKVDPKFALFIGMEYGNIDTVINMLEITTWCLGVPDAPLVSKLVFAAARRGDEDIFIAVLGCFGYFWKAERFQEEDFVELVKMNIGLATLMFLSRQFRHLGHLGRLIGLEEFVPHCSEDEEDEEEEEDDDGEGYDEDADVGWGAEWL